jgi:hypothetical protein
VPPSRAGAQLNSRGVRLSVRLAETAPVVETGSPGRGAMRSKPCSEQIGAVHPWAGFK